MNKILCEGDFVEQIDCLKTVPFNITSSRGKPTLEQTKRNKVRGELLDGLTRYLDAILDGTSAAVYRVNEGVSPCRTLNMTHTRPQLNGTKM